MDLPAHLHLHQGFFWHRWLPGDQTSLPQPMPQRLQAQCQPELQPRELTAPGT